MGGQTSRMVREIVEDSMYIVRQTNRATYQESVAARLEVESKIQQLRKLRRDKIESAEEEQTRVELFKQLEGAATHKKMLDEQTAGFTKQFELPKELQSIADKHVEELKKAQEKQANGGSDSVA
ncbi:hypothetical protein P43SY_001109 [Pythium insidiosum]|uniref:Uncharacterized protein n=1 Tax=Pythium insidiosum TaxID=114742 RepID=A0AAD5QDQ8_PYTIN|nr:hypothetical protein P43SY_001109 [Pythium insidiosum]